MKYFLIRLVHFIADHPLYDCSVVLSLLALILITFFVLIRPYRRARLEFMPQAEQTPGLKIAPGKALLLSTLCLLFLGAITLLLSTAWIKGDDYLFHANGMGLSNRCFRVLFTYFFGNSRFGELIAAFLRCPDNRWPVLLFNPLSVVAVPFALWRAFSRAQESIISYRGCVFVSFGVALMLVSACLSPWRNFWCFAASANYLWPSVATIFFLSLLNPHRPITFRLHEKSERAKLLGIFILGVCCAWSMECLTVILVPGLFLWCVVLILRKKPIEMLHRAMFTGSLWGAFFLFGSTSLQARAEAAIEERRLKPELFSPAEMEDFLHNLTWPVVQKLNGAGNIIVLDGIPTLKHLYFAPFLLERYLLCAAIVSAVFLLLLALVALLRASRNKWDYLLAGGLLLASVGSAFSYLARCIPTCMSFFPACLFTTAAACLLFHRLLRAYPRLCVLLAAALIAYDLSIFVPAGVEAWHLKPYEKVILRHIHTAEKGSDLVFDNPVPVRPADPLRLTNMYIFTIKENVRLAPNIFIAPTYDLATVSMKNPYRALPGEEAKFNPIYRAWHYAIAKITEACCGRQIPPFTISE